MYIYRVVLRAFICAKLVRGGARVHDFAFGMLWLYYTPLTVKLSPEVLCANYMHCFDRRENQRDAPRADVGEHIISGFVYLRHLKVLMAHKLDD